MLELSIIKRIGLRPLHCSSSWPVLRIRSGWSQCNMNTLQYIEKIRPSASAFNEVRVAAAKWCLILEAALTLWYSPNLYQMEICNSTLCIWWKYNQSYFLINLINLERDNPGQWPVFIKSKNPWGSTFQFPPGPNCKYLSACYGKFNTVTNLVSLLHNYHQQNCISHLKRLQLW